MSDGGNTTNDGTGTAEARFFDSRDGGGAAAAITDSNSMYLFVSKDVGDISEYNLSHKPMRGNNYHTTRNGVGFKTTRTGGFATSHSGKQSGEFSIAGEVGRTSPPARRSKKSGHH